jgi:hypothetical protein
VIWLVELIQNLPFAAAFMFGYAYFTASSPVRSILWVLAGVIAGALLIRFTEPLIASAPIETPAETLTNIVYFGLAILGFIYYFSWNLGSWIFDLALALAAGAVLTFFQARAAGERPSFRHLAAMGFSFSAAVLLIRFWALEAGPYAATFALAAAATTIIVIIDYGRPLR